VPPTDPDRSSGLPAGPFSGIRRRELAELIAAGALALALVVASREVLLADGDADVPAAVGVAPAAAAAPSASPAERGRALFQAKGCGGCHSAPGLTSPIPVGPDLGQGLAGVAAARRPGLSAEAYLRQSMLDPSTFRVPGYEERGEMPKLALTESDVAALVAFLLDRP
jgi:cytochrome c oxidase subunit 2